MNKNNKIIKKRFHSICSKCVMDTSDPNILFDNNGVCDHCHEFENYVKPNWHKGAKGKFELEKVIEKIKKSGKNKEFNCLLGLSGGVDSSYMLHMVVNEFGLRPLVFHVDGGWNSELAQNNIANLVRKLNVDLYTHVIDWGEYKNLMLSFLEADVIDVELLYDNAMFGLNYKQANKYGIKYILSGMNTTSEGMVIPKSWNWHKYDKRNIVQIGKKFKNVKLRTFPAIGTAYYIYSKFFRGIQWVPFPDYFQFNKVDVMKILESEFDYKPYPYKHYESVFTRFYQAFILPKKFNVDKRRVHLGTLVAAGQLNRNDAINDLKGIPYPSDRAFEDDKEYFLKKIGWTSKDLDTYISRPRKSHSDYPSEKSLFYAILKGGNERPLYYKIKKTYKYIRLFFRKLNSHKDFTKLK